MKEYNSVDVLLSIFAGACIGSGIVGMYYETKVIPDFTKRVENLNFHNDFLRKCISDFESLKSERK